MKILFDNSGVLTLDPRVAGSAEAVLEHRGKMTQIMADLKENGHEIGIATNAKYTPLTAKLNGFPKDKFDVVLEDVEKSSARTWPVIFDKVNDKPENVLLVDDAEENVDVAKQMGAQGVTFTGADKLREDLERRSILKPRF